jgi:hypothetical protein
MLHLLCGGAGRRNHGRDNDRTQKPAQAWHRFPSWMIVFL